ncbi:hypothetical protein AWU65_16025 [Paenibacillus glucanolyticus]|uniref:Uncharacterized protein n=1 Tax=Paenibacillus glucanolyticus TaxID=59843 RepID=A0A163KL35_9BACL|nr:hypothetical protein AWU65_16025 [Paenibacillus glucanolyticus]
MDILLKCPERIAAWGIYLCPGYPLTAWALRLFSRMRHRVFLYLISVCWIFGFAKDLPIKDKAAIEPWVQRQRQFGMHHSSNDR